MRPIFPSKRWPILVVVITLATSSCAVNDRGFVSVDRYHNATTRVVQLEAWGLHLVTVPGDEGLTLGWSSRTYVHAKAGAAAPHGIGGAMVRAEAADLQPVEESDALPSLADLPAPLAWRSARIGIGLDFGRSRAGLTVGYRSRHALRVPRDFAGTLLLIWNESDLPKSRVVIERGIP